MNSSLIINILLMYGILILVNVPATFLGIDFQETEPRSRLWFEPPGYVIPVAWFVLFTLLGVARHLINQVNESTTVDWLIIGLAVACASYAYYTLGLANLTGVSALWYGLIGNLIVILLALFVTYKVYAVVMAAALLVLPVALWTAFATAIVIGELKVQGLL